MKQSQYTWTVKSPDGRELFRETGGRDAEARAKGLAERFNASLPRSARSFD